MSEKEPMKPGQTLLRKFEGEVSAEEIDAGVQPVEVVLVENGVVVKRWEGEDVANAPD